MKSKILSLRVAIFRHLYLWTIALVLFFIAPCSLFGQSSSITVGNLSYEYNSWETSIPEPIVTWDNAAGYLRVKFLDTHPTYSKCKVFAVWIKVNGTWEEAYIMERKDWSGYPIWSISDIADGAVAPIFWCPSSAPIDAYEPTSPFFCFIHRGINLFLNDYSNNMGMHNYFSSSLWTTFLTDTNRTSTPNVYWTDLNGPDNFRAFSFTWADDGSSRYCKFAITNIPAEIQSAGSIEVKVFQLHDYNISGIVKTFTLNVTKPGTPTGLTTTTDHCSSIVLSWTNPANIAGTVDSMYQTVIFRNDVAVDVVNGNKTTYTDDDPSLVRDVQYSYYIQRIKWNKWNRAFNAGNNSVTKTGTLKTRPIQPTNVSASTNNCNAIDVSWNWDVSNPYDFVISRSTFAAGPFTEIGTTSATARIYSDNSIIRGSRYYYKLVARDTCLTESSEAFVSGVAPSDPSLATNLSLTKDSVNNKMTVSWTDNASNETKYIIRRLDDSGNQLNFDVNASNNFNTALNLDGNNDNVALPNSVTNNINGGTAITIEFWYKGSSASSAVRFQDGGGNWIIAGWSDKHIISTDGGTAGISIGSSAVVYDGNWHHIAMVWQKNTTNGFRSYLDGILVEQRNSANVNLPVISGGCYLGAFNGSSEFTNGTLDEVRIWNVVRTQVQIQSYMNTSVSTGSAGLVAYYQFEDGVPGGDNTALTKITDSKGQYHGTLSNFSLTGSGSNFVYKTVNTMSYIDDSPLTCIQYTYNVRTVNACNLTGLPSTASVSGTLPPPNLTAVFDSNKKLTGSKGYYNDRVDLSWDCNNASIITSFKLYKKGITSSSDSVLITTLSATSRTYSDYTTDAGVLYKYTLVGVVNCNGEDRLSNCTEDIGFRCPVATVNGHIQYTGAVAVNNVKVRAERTSGVAGYAASFNGNGNFSVSNTLPLNPQNSLTLEAWVKPTNLGTYQFLIFKDNSYVLLISPENKFVFEITIGATAYYVSANTILQNNQYYHVCGVYNGSAIKIFINGVLMSSVNVSGPVNANVNPVKIGGRTGDFFSGSLDEIRIWNIARSDIQVERNFEKLLYGNETGLVALYHADEGYGSAIYDISKTGTNYNEHHGYLSGSGITFSSNIPSSSLLGYVAYTDSLGDYTISGIRYYGIGENFKITPGLGVHTFTPGNKVLFLGDGATVQNAVDFTDESSFQVTGNVKYSPVNSCNCPAEGVFLKVDGSYIIQNGSPIQTDVNGNFEANVPIGNHYITAEKPNHTFLVGRWPASGTYDFQEPISGIQFIDSTFVKIVGRVVGGTRESSKPMILGKSTNNIGSANIAFVSQNSCYSTTVTTADSSGDYMIMLPPLSYTIPNFSTTNASSPNLATFQNSVFNDNDLLNLTLITPMQTITDSVYNEQNQLVRVDAGTYQVIRSWTYRTSPSLWVYDNFGRDFASYGGDSILIYDNTMLGTIDTIIIKPSPFSFPAFTQHANYDLQVGAVELYVKQHASLPDVNDNVPVTSGVFTFNNALADEIVTVMLQDSGYISNNLDTAYVAYSFSGGSPNTTFNSGDPNNFAQQFSISFSSGPNTVNWLPGAGSTPFKGILMGAKSSNGSSFVTSGPQVTEMILRDPPGSASFASFEAGTSNTITNSYTLKEQLGGEFEAKVKAGTKMNIGLGVSTHTEMKLETAIKANIQLSTNQNWELSTKITTTESWNTSAEQFVGADGDIYFGKAMNYKFGLADNITIIPSDKCGLQGVDCRAERFINGGVEYAVARKKTLAVVPGGYSTAFMYTQNHIVTKLIPRLTELRNQLFVGQPGRYVSHLPFDNVNYGKNNDDPVFGPYTPGCTNCASSSNSIDTDTTDYTGLSYTFFKPDNDVSVSVQSTDGTWDTITIAAEKADSIRWYNQQIRLWKEAVILNEKEKYDALQNPSTLIQNYSISGGVSYNNSVTTEKTNSFTYDFELSTSLGLAFEISGEAGGVGASAKLGLTMGLTGGYSRSNEDGTTCSFGYTLSDTEVGDFHSIDIRKSRAGFGPCFNIQAGETSCPYEGEIQSLYHTVNGQPVTLSGGTLQREMVAIKVDGSPSYSSKMNIPSDGQAVFDLELINQTETNDDNDYRVKILANTNPDGAVFSIDGYIPSDQIFSVPANGSIHKQLVARRGAIAYDYDSIAVVVYTECDPEQVADTIFVSAHFLPSCTDVAISNPLDQWVVNNSFNDTLTLIIDDYDINYFGFDFLKFQYKPSSQSSWISQQTWYNEVDTPGPDTLAIPTDNAYTMYQWSLIDVPDGNYNIRSISGCTYAGMQSTVLTGVIDRINPSAFGTPTPADGILDPNDDISIQFNEPIDLGTINTYNFDVRGVLNGTQLNHYTSLYFDGSNDYADVLGGANLQNRDFTIEFWAKRVGLGEQAIVSQGVDAGMSMFLGFNSSNNVVFRLGNKQVASAGTYSLDGQWHHFAVAYSVQNGTALLFVDGELVNELNNALSFSYVGAGKLVFGKENYSNSKFFNGNVHGIRLWNKERSESEIQSQMNLFLDNSSQGLLYDWRMDEADGSIAADNIRSRNATIYGAGWQINPNGNAASFDGTDDRLRINTTRIGLTEEMDFTIEFWFNSNQAAPATLFSNGKGDGTGSDSLIAWNIQKDASGKIHVYHRGYDFVAVNANYFDGQWHHFALVMQRTGNLSAYIDGNLKNSTPASIFSEIGGSFMHLGVRAYMTGIISNYDNYFNGKIDEFRIWNLSRKVEQIRRDKQYRLMGTESGLIVYIPFENYQLQLGVPVLTASFNNYSPNTSDSVSTQEQNGASLISQTPVIKLPRPVQSVPVTYSVNNDKIVITPNISSGQIENVTLDVTVKDVNDLHGNEMQSPKTWIAYVNKNQIKWQDDLITDTIIVGNGLSFTTNIANTGGALKEFTISNIPSWLTLSEETGYINPNSIKTIQFTVSSAINIGTYEEDILLTTDFGYAEALTVKLKVKAIEPILSFDPSVYQYSMNIIGQLKIDNIISSNEGDILIAYVDNQIRGIGTLEYVPTFDRYEVFMSVYSNEMVGDTVGFEIWSSANGETYIDVTPLANFEDGKIIGSPSLPETYSATTGIRQNFELNQGWTWVSFPIVSEQFQSSTNLFQGISSAVGDLSVGQAEFDQYSSYGWLGTLTSSGGYGLTKTYKIKSALPDTMILSGTLVSPDTIPLSVNTGWNWIGFISNRNLPVNSALANFDAISGDLIKGQYRFAYYDASLGWIGNLATMIPGEGYMLKASLSGTFNYPSDNKSMFVHNSLKSNTPEVSDFHPETFNNNMSVIAHTNICKDLISDNNYILKVFNGDELRGVAIPYWIEEKDQYFYFLTVYSNTNDEVLQFQFEDLTDGFIYPSEQIMTFTDNHIAGTPDTPFEISVDESLNCNLATTIAEGIVKDDFVEIFPNPFNSFFTVQFMSPTYADIKIYDAVGKVVYDGPDGNIQQISIYLDKENATAVSGVYFVKITTSQKSKTYKMVKY